MPYTRFKQADFGSAYSGLSTVGYALINTDNTVNTARTTTGVTERGTGTGTYGAIVTMPDGFTGEIRWDTGGAAPVFASSPVNPGDSEFLNVPVAGKAVVTGTPGTSGSSIKYFSTDGTTELETLSLATAGTRQ